MTRAEKRRAYYASHRKQVLASNKRCAERRGHLWKKPLGPKYIRRLVTCVDCGAEVYAGKAVRFPRRIGRVKFYRCQECESEIERELVQSAIRGSKALEAKQLFVYGLQQEENGFDLSDYLEDFVSLLKHLDSRYRAILELRLCEHQTLAQIGKKFGVTRERVRQMVTEGVNVLREAIVREQVWKESYGAMPEALVKVAMKYRKKPKAPNSSLRQPLMRKRYYDLLVNGKTLKVFKYEM